MYSTLKNLHSYWAYLVLIMLVIAVVNAVIMRSSGKTYTIKSLRIALFTLIVTHIQLLLGMILYFISPLFDLWSSMGSGVMKDSATRLLLVEHPITNIIAIILITVGFSKHKRMTDSAKQYKTIMIFYGLGLLFLLSRIPWNVWPGF